MECSTPDFPVPRHVPEFTQIHFHWTAPNSRPTGKDPDVGQDWRQKEKREAEDGMLEGITDSMDMNLGYQDKSRFFFLKKNKCFVKIYLSTNGVLSVQRIYQFLP